MTATSFAAPWLTSARLGSFARQVSQRGAAVSLGRTRIGPDASFAKLSPESECIRADKCATRLTTNHDKNTVGGAVNALLSFTQASWLSASMAQVLA